MSQDGNRERYGTVGIYTPDTDVWEVKQREVTEQEHLAGFQPQKGPIPRFSNKEDPSHLNKASRVLHLWRAILLTLKKLNAEKKVPIFQKR